MCIVTLFSIVLPGILLVFQTAFSQQRQSLTVEACIRLGLENSKMLHASLMKVQAADAKVEETRAARLPSVRFGVAYSRLSRVPPFEVSLPFPAAGPSPFTLSPVILNSYATRLSLQQPIFTGFRVESSMKIAGDNAQALRQDHASGREDLIFGIRRGYWSLYKAIGFQKVLDENVERVTAHLRDVENFYGQGMATKDEVLKVKVQLSNANLSRIQARTTVRLAATTLCNLIGLPLDTEIQPQSDVDPHPKRAGDLEPLISQALAGRSDMKAMELRVKAGEGGVRLARSGRLPQVFLTGGYAYDRPNPRILPARDRFKGTWDVGVAISVSVWDWGMAASQTHQAMAQFLQAQDRLDQLRDDIRLEVTQDYLNLVEAGERISVAEQGVGQAEENYRIVSERFRNGIALNTDLLDSEVALLQAKTNYTQTLVDYQLALAGLERATGQ